MSTNCIERIRKHTLSVIKSVVSYMTFGLKELSRIESGVNAI